MTRTSASGKTWAIVLAAGNGSRLSSLTQDSAGAAVPKQFCSLDGERTLFQQALTRAGAVADKQRVTTVVAPGHRQYWLPTSGTLPSANVVVQPDNRGTAVGILLPVLRIAARDPDALVLILPADHHVCDEAILARAMRRALEDVREHPIGVALLGIEADEAEPELGYIVPRALGHSSLWRVDRFVEKPPHDEALRLIRSGALWNSFILACRATSLIDLLRRRYPDVVGSLQDAVSSGDHTGLERIYVELPSIDFSRHIATGHEPLLMVAPVPRCGWNDLGTPHRLAQTLAQWPKHRWMKAASATGEHDGWINLPNRLALIHPTLLPEL